MKFRRKCQINSTIENYFVWPLLYLLIILILTVVLFSVNSLAAYMALIVFCILTIISGALIYIARKYLLNEIINFALNFGVIQKNLLYKFPIPYVLLDQNGKIRWHNEKFKNIIDNDKVIDKTIKSIIPEITIEKFPKEKNQIINMFIELNNNYYKIEIERLEVSDNKAFKNKKINYKNVQMYGICLFDETEIKELQIKNEDNKIAFAMLYIDNYEESLQSIEDVRRPLLVALIDRNISKFAQNIDAVVRKLEKDKYFIVFQQKYIKDLKSAKFNILEEIRSINIGNEMAVTLSMGIGVNGDTFQQSVEYASTAMDLALGRGGDQAVIKDKEKLYYYGGKTKIVEKSTRVKSRIKAQALKELIEAKDNVIIMGHKLQDLDSIGAAIGIYRIAKYFNKKAYIIINEVTTSVRSLYERFIKDDEYEYDMFIDSSVAISKSIDNTLLVVVDVNRPSYTECPELLRKSNNIVVFDHHRASTDYIDNAVLTYIEPYASSTCEMITEIIQYIDNEIKLKPLEADALFAGITVDTKNFMVKTGIKTFEAAAFLRRNGADAVRVRKLFRNDIVTYKARAEAIKNAQIYRECLAITECPSKNLESPTVVAAQTADELLNITGVKASFALTQIDTTIYFSARSIDEINVQLIMEKLGGGGHLNIAGAQIKDYTVENAIILLKEIIDKLIKEGDLVWK